MNIDKKKKKRLVLLIALFLFVLFVSACIFLSLENIDFTNAFYLSTMTITTVGHGNISPETNSGKIFGSILSIFGVTMFWYTIAVVTSTINDE